ncbi:MAG: Phospholipase, partial [Acidimicrobiales bacterium]|nr:Phospholipase [Acidimicrobiales bacterium]
KAHLVFDNDGSVGAVFHVYDRQRLSEGPRRYTVEPRKPLHDRWELTKGAYDLWVLGPNGFHRHFKGDGQDGPVTVAAYDIGAPRLGLALTNPTREALDLTITTNAYGPSTRPTQVRLPPRGNGHQWLSLGRVGGWYDISIAWPARPGWLRRYAGRMETGRDSISDPAMAGPATMGWTA